MLSRTEDRATITSDTTVATVGGVEISPTFPATVATDREDLRGVDLRGGNECWILKLDNVAGWLIGGILTTRLDREFYQTTLPEDERDGYIPPS